MSNPELNRLMDNARIKLPGALDSAIKMELFNVFKEFFIHTNIWEEDIPFDVTATTLSRVTAPEAYTYEVVPTEGTIIRLLGVRDEQGYGVGATMATPGHIILNRSPNVGGTFTATVVKTVSDPVTRQEYPVFPGWILENYFEEILHGLLGKTMAHIAKPYSSPQMAQYHLRFFQAGMSRASRESQHKNLYGAQSWRFPQTFTRRRFTRI